MLLETGDADAVSIRAVATAVGVTSPAIYLHFDDKQALLDAICDVRFAELNKAMDAAAARSDEPLESLRLRGEAYVRFAVDNPEHYRLLMMTKNPESHKTGPSEGIEPSQGAIAFAKLVESVGHCIENGDLQEIDPMDGALVLWAGVHGLSSLLISTPNFGWPDDIIDKLLGALVFGLAPR
ncbi:MAG TPA: TetR/AcrR family transcriptional regulator [Actinomycetota bacterium]|nr:TetR/AcrR family transcriptional regulator [Actinomycetota bacterium]